MVNPYLLIVAVFGVAYMIYTVKIGIPPMIESQRFDQLFYGPINQTFSMVINGMVTLRSYRKFDYFRIEFMKNIEKSANSTFCYIIANRWVGIRLDIICLIFGMVTTILCICLRNVIDKKLLSFSLQLITDVIVLFSVSIRMFAEV